MKKPSPPITPKIVIVAKKHLKDNKLNQHDIAALFGINQGRISEIKHGKYDHLINGDDHTHQSSLF